MELCDNDELIKSVLTPVISIRLMLDLVEATFKQRNRIPTNSDEELALRYSILQSVKNDPDKVYGFTFAYGKRKKMRGLNCLGRL